MVAKFYIAAILIILIFPFLFTQKSFLNIDFSKTGQIGDTIGGLIGPFVAIIAASLTFLAFWIQYRANQIQIKNFNEQRRDIKLERFQNKFFELLKIHKDNVEQINSIFKENYFRVCINDLKTIYQLTVKFYLDFYHNDPLKDKYLNKDYDEDLLNIAYLSFWLGNDKESRNTIHNLMKKKLDSHFISKLFDWFESVNYKYFGYAFLQKKKGHRPMFIYNDKSSDMVVISVDKNLFIERSSILGHYFRHLFQTIKYVDEQDEDIINYEAKYNYIKNLRAQLTNHEQILLYYNSLSVFGSPWLEIQNNDLLSSFMIKYKMIKNIPLPFTNFSIRPEVKFNKEIVLLNQKNPSEELFEWHEILKRGN